MGLKRVDQGGLVEDGAAGDVDYEGFGCGARIWLGGLAMG